MDIESVYKQYFKDVFLYLRSLSADAGTAEELAQETFMKALKSLDSFDGSRDPGMAVCHRQEYVLYVLPQRTSLCRSGSGRKGCRR